MEIEKILSEIRSKVGQTRISDRTLTTYINRHAPKDGDPDEAFFNDAVEFVRELNGNYSHDVATDVNTQVETKINEFKKNYKPQQEPPKPDKPDEGNELLKRLEALEKERENEKKALAVNSLRSEVKSKADELKVSNKALWNDVVAAIEVKDGATSESLLGEAKKAYEQKLKDYTGEGAMPYGGSQRGGSPQVSSEEAKDKREAFKKRMQAQGRLPKEEE